MFSRLRGLSLLNDAVIGSPMFGSGWRAASVWSFGDNSNGALGLPSPLSDAYEPVKVPSLPSDVTCIAAGHYHSLAVTSAGEVWAWGRNEEGQLGRGAAAPRERWYTPERVVGLDNVKVRAAFASGVVSAAISEDGSLWVWGRSKRGQLGLGNGVTEAISPSKVHALTGHMIVKVSFGWGHVLAQTHDGKLIGWGYSENGRLGKIGKRLDRPITFNPKFDKQMKNLSSVLEAAEKFVEEKIKKEDNMPIIWEPCITEELGGNKVSDVACGLDHSLVLCSNGDLLSCGENIYGQLGRNSKGYEMLPVNINKLPISLAAGLGHSLVVCSISSGEIGEGTCLLSWGWNRSHQLGRQGQEEVPGIVETLNVEGLFSVSAGRVHSIALTSKGELWSWGSGRNGRLGHGSSLDEMEPAMVESLEGIKVDVGLGGRFYGKDYLTEEGKRLLWTMQESNESSLPAKRRTRVK